MLYEYEDEIQEAAGEAAYEEFGDDATVRADSIEITEYYDEGRWDGWHVEGKCAVTLTDEDGDAYDDDVTFSLSVGGDDPDMAPGGHDDY